MSGGKSMTTPVARRLNHVEFVHRPGERDLVFALFDLLGLETFEVMDGEVLIGVVDPPSFQLMDNDNYLAGREVRPEQWAFDQALAEALAGQTLAAPLARFQDFLTQKPHWGMHFGFHLSSPDNWEASVARLEDIDKHAPSLSGRVRLLKVFRRGDAGAPSVLHQAFLWTDVIASGSLALGQRIELATMLP
jgi:hypothetical protein